MSRDCVSFRDTLASHFIMGEQCEEYMYHCPVVRYADKPLVKALCTACLVFFTIGIVGDLALSRVRKKDISNKKKQARFEKKEKEAFDAVKTAEKKIFRTGNKAKKEAKKVQGAAQKLDGIAHEASRLQSLRTWVTVFVLLLEDIPQFCILVYVEAAWKYPALSRCPGASAVGLTTVASIFFTVAGFVQRIRQQHNKELAAKRAEEKRVKKTAKHKRLGLTKKQQKKKQKQKQKRESEME